MCNLYSQTNNVQGVMNFTRAMVNRAGNLPSLPAVFPDYEAPIVRENAGGRTLAKARWGMPNPAFALAGRKTDPGVTNIRNVKSPHWRRWLGPGNRCVVPFTSFSEFNRTAGGDVWFALGEDRRLAAFAGLWTPLWRSTRKLKEGEVTVDLFGFLTTEPNAEVAEIHPKTMPVILRTIEEIDAWLTLPWTEAAKLQRPLPDGVLKIVAKGTKKDERPSP